MNITKATVNHRRLPPPDTRMSAFSSLYLHHSIPHFFQLTAKPNPPKHQSIFISTRTSDKQICCSSSSFYSFNESSKPENKDSSPQSNDESDESPNKKPPPTFVDEWGDKSEPEPDTITKFSDSDPPAEEADDEWGGVGVGNDGFGNGVPEVDNRGSERLEELKRAFVDTVYGSEFGFRVASEVRAEALELVAQLEASNPTPSPTERPELLDGNWVLLFTAFSELLPLLAVGSIPSVKVEKICQSINSSSLTIENSTTISSPVASVSFSASAAFEVRSPSRVQVEFKEGTFRPPEIKSSIELPQSVDIFGQNINLSPVQQSLSPLQNAVDGIARAISGQPPLKVPIPGERAKSWLLITYLDKDLRISRGDGGLFVLAKEGSPLLEQ